MLAPAEYKTIFEINLAAVPWSIFLNSSLFILLGIAFYRFSKRQLFQVFGLITSAFGFFFFLILFTAIVPRYIRLRYAYKNGQTKVIEGRVEDFHPMTAHVSPTESFTVGGVFFVYAVGDNPCFTNGVEYKRPIHDGLNVRIFYDDGCIQRLDVGK